MLGSVSELTYEQKLRFLILRKNEIRTCVMFHARESVKQFTSVLPLSLWLTAAGLHLLFSSTSYNPGCVTVLQHDVFTVRCNSDGTCLHLNRNRDKIRISLDTED